MKRIHTLLIYIGCLCLAVFAACQDILYYTLYQDLPKKEWDSNDAICFSIPSAEQDLDVTVTLGVRTTTSFRYKDIVARVEVLEGDSVLSVTPLNLTLYTDENGLRKGMLLNENYSKPQPFHMQAHHNYTLRVTHLMRLNPLDEVMSVGVMVER